MKFPATILWLSLAGALLPLTGWSAEPAVSCDIQTTACSGRTAGGIEVTFDIQPKPVRAMTELRLSVVLTSAGKPVHDARVEIDLTMPGMYMGKNTPLLRHAGDGRYEGSGFVTRCASGRKTWHGEVRITAGNRTETSGFTFEVR